MRKFFSFLSILSLFLTFLPGFTLAANEPGVLVVKFKDSETAAAWQGRGFPMEQVYDNIYRFTTSDISSARDLLISEQGVEFVEQDNQLHLEANAADPLFVLDENELTKQWYLPKIQIHQAWNLAVGNNIIIAVVDTGIDARHEDLNDGRVIKGYSSYCQTAAQNDPTNCLIRVTGELSAGVNSDDNGHGTIVAGLIGAIPNNNNGMAGVNWNVKLMPIKALDSHGSGLASDVSAGIRWATDNGAKVINLSIGGQGLDGVGVLQDAITYAYNKGVLIVAAAGNDSAESGVSLNATPVLPVCADGGQNMVVGVAGLMMSIFPDLDVKAIRERLLASVDNVDAENQSGCNGGSCVGQIGRGRLNAFKAVSESSGFVSGAILRAPDNSLYLIERGLRRPLSNFVYGQRFSGFSAQAATAEQLNIYPLGSAVAPVDGSLVKSSDNPTVYLMEGGTRQALSYLSFISRNLRFESVTSLPNVEMATYPLGADAPILSGALLKASNHPAVYVLNNGSRQLLSFFVFQQRGFEGKPIAVLDPSDLGRYPLHPQNILYPPTDGTLIRGDQSATVYVFEGSVRRGLTLSAFQARGYNFGNVRVVPQSEVNGYAIGSDLLN